jgi:hypothetical protein
MKRGLLTRVVGIGVLVIALFLCSVTGACSWLEKNLFSSSEGIQFKVPDGAIALQEAELKASSEKITVCNHSGMRWSNLKVQISTIGTTYEESLPPHQPVYIAQIQDLDGAKCKEIPIGDFVDPSPKRLKAYRGIRVTKIELLADIQLRAYAVQEFSAH